MQTRAYDVSSALQLMTLHTHAAAGVWVLCYKPTAAGLWTLVTDRYLFVEHQATHTPPVGIAGSITPLTFTNSSDRDVIVLQKHNCSNAHLASTAKSSRRPTKGVADDVIRRGPRHAAASP